MLSSIAAGAIAGGINDSMALQNYLRQQAFLNQQAQIRTGIAQQEAANRQTLFDQAQAQALASRRAEDQAFLQQYGQGLPVPGQTALPPQSNQVPAPMPGQSSMPAQQPSAYAVASRNVQAQALPPMSMASNPPPAPTQQQAQQSAFTSSARMPQALPSQSPVQPQGNAPQSAVQPTTAQAMDRIGMMLEQATRQMQSPMAQRIADDPHVQKAQDEMHSIAEEFRKSGVDPMNPQLTLEQHERVMLAQQRLSSASAMAAKNIGESDKNAIDLGKAYTTAYAQQQHLLMLQKMLNRGGASGPDAPIEQFGDLPKNEQAIVEDAVAYKQTHNGNLPQNMRYNRGRLGTLGAIANSISSNGDPSYYQNAFDVTSINKADATSINKIVSLVDGLSGAYSTFDKNMNNAVDFARKYGLNNAMPINKVENYLRTKIGDPQAAEYMAYINTVRKEMAKLVQGGNQLGARGNTVSAVKEANDILDSNFTIGQLEGVKRAMDKDGPNLISSYEDRIQLRRDAIRNRFKDGDTGFAPTSNIGASSGTHATKQPFVNAQGVKVYTWNGKGYTESGIRDQARKSGVSFEKALDMMGYGQ
jgi:hypothetical protein